MKIFGDTFGGVSTETVGERKAFITFVGTTGKTLTEVIVASDHSADRSKSRLLYY